VKTILLLTFVSHNYRLLPHIFVQVRRHVMSHANMYRLQRLLMTTSSLAALLILFQQQMVDPWICLVSLILNFIHRHHDVSNVLLTAVLFYYIPLY
jgi:hypothetical protein